MKIHYSVHYQYSNIYLHKMLSQLLLFEFLMLTVCFIPYTNLYNYNTSYHYPCYLTKWYYLLHYVAL